MFIPDPDFSIPDTGIQGQKALDPGSGSAKKKVSLFLT
jgi:hypothetical protein